MKHWICLDCKSMKEFFWLPIAGVMDRDMICNVAVGSLIPGWYMPVMLITITNVS